MLANILFLKANQRGRLLLGANKYTLAYTNIFCLFLLFFFSLEKSDNLIKNTYHLLVSHYSFKSEGV